MLLNYEWNHLSMLLNKLLVEKAYLTAFTRTPFEANSETYNLNMKLSFTDKIPYVKVK